MSDLKKYTDYKTILAVGLICYSKGKCLLLKRAKTKKVDPGVFSVVGGKVEPGESFVDAVVRETREEIGLFIDKAKLKPLGLKQTPDAHANAEWVIANFVLELPEQTVFPATDDGEFLWMAPQDLTEENSVIDVIDTVKALSKSRNILIYDFWNYDKTGKVISHKEDVFTLTSNS